MPGSTIDLAGETSASSENEAPPSPPPTRPSRPKLRTRRVVREEEEEEDADLDEVELRVVLRPQPQPSKRPSRQRSQVATYRAEEEEGEEENEEEEAEEAETADDDYEQPEEQAEEEDDDDMEEFVDDSSVEGRRRSGRVRQQKGRRQRQAEEVYDSEEGDFEVPERPRRRRSSSSAQPNSASSSSSRKRKRPQSSSSARSKSRKPRRQSYEDDEEDEMPRKKKSEADEEDEDVDEDWLMTDDDALAKDAVDDEVDENAFIVEKILAREVHTIKEWKRLRENKTTRFLQNASIFLDDDEEEDENGNVKTKKADESNDVVVVVDGPDGGKEAQEEERFLIKWKNLSYIHVSWETEKNLMEVDRNVKGKIQRFIEKEMMGLLTDKMHGDEYFNPEFRDVDRILDIQDKPGDKYTPVDDEEDGNEGTKHLKYMLVKWKALPYDAITWEREDDVHDDAAVKEYEARVVRAAQRYEKMASSSKSSARNQSRKINFRGYSATNRPPFKEEQTFELRDYQLTGVNWMLFNWYQKRNSMLADEMGLGKTVQTVTYVNHLAVVEELPGPYLIIAPLSTLGHWQREFTNWTNLNAVVYHGSADARKVIQNYEFVLTEEEYQKAFKLPSGKAKLPKPKTSAPCYRFDVLITTYEMCSAADFSKLSRVKWQLLVVDEAHRLKNRNSKLSLILKKNFVYENILLLTGTPLQNNVEELWTLLNFLDPDRFDSMEGFLEDYGELKDASQVEKLHGELKPFLLRRMKEDVEKSLAPKEETIIEVELTVLQKQYYRAIYEQNTEFLARGMKKSHAPSLMNVLMELRKCCNHPFLIKGMEQREVARIREQKDLSKEEIERQAVELLVTASGKLILLDKLLPRLKENGHRVLIFSQFKIMLDILQDYLKLRSYRCERIDGNITGNDRQAAIDRFSDPESSAFIMLLSTRAGGVGINLTSADTVIIYDSDWNPQNDLQAQARCHRIGQKKSVKIYRLLTAKTYELHMFHQASLKLGLDQAVLGSIRDQQSASDTIGKTKRPNAQMSKNEIENLLKHGAYEMFKEDKDGEAEAASKRFSEESIDQILNRSTKIIHDPKAAEGADDGKKSLMSSFSKATFVSSDNPDAQVALDDPDFWTKVVGLQEPKPVEPSPLKKRRCRKQVKTYLQEYSDDDKPVKRGRGRPKKQDAEYEEFVISSSAEDDDDDDDDEGTDELDDDDFEGGKGGKRRRKVLTTKVKISAYQERVAELLTTFGYGRWQEMLSSCATMRQFSLVEIADYSQQYLASQIRVAATNFLTSKQPQPIAPGIPIVPPPPTAEELFESLNQYATRYRFVDRLLADRKVKHIGLVPVTYPGLSLVAMSAKAERDATARLQQVDRMYQCYLIVRQQIGPLEPMLELLKDFQRVKTPHQIPRMIMEGKLPPHRYASKPIKAANQSAQTEANGTPDNVESVRDSVDAKPEALTQTYEVSAESKEDVPVESKGDVAETIKPGESTSREEPKDKEEADVTESSPQVESASEAKTEQPVSESPSTSGGALSVLGGIGKKMMGILGLSRQEVDDAATGDKQASTTGRSVLMSENDTEKKSSPTTPSSSEAAPIPASNPAVETSSQPKTDVPQAEPATAQTTPTSTPSTSSASPEDKTAVKEQHLKVALTRLQTLPDVGNGHQVAPWWISLVDDVMLLLYVYKNGWVKARFLPEDLINSTMFGARARATDVGLYPNTTVLNRRVKMLLSTWSNIKRLAAHARGLRLRQQLQNPPVAAVPTSALQQLADARRLHGLTHPHLVQVAPNHAGLHPKKLPVPPERPQQPMYNAAKRNCFAKHIYSYGVPDTSRCTLDTDKMEKWRYFLSDSQLDVARFPLREVMEEARSLEQYCRLRLQQHPDAPPPQPSVADPIVPSILGGRRGTWMLSHQQARRLVYRIDIFRVLREELLILPPKKLVDVMNHIVDEIQGAKSTEFPPWWTFPRHDIMLLQGVECFGLDDHLAQVWKLPLFVTTNPSGVFPSFTWTENHVHDLAARAHALIGRAKAQAAQLRAQADARAQARAHAIAYAQTDAAVRSQVQAHTQAQAHAQGQAHAHAQAQRRAEMEGRLGFESASAPRPGRDSATNIVDAALKSEMHQRVAAIQGMRMEDPLYSTAVRARKQNDTAEVKLAKRRQMADLKQKEQQEELQKRMTEAAATLNKAQAEIRASARDTLNAIQETRLMKLEDPYHSNRPRAVWLEQVRQDEIAATNKRAAELRPRDEIEKDTAAQKSSSVQSGASTKEESEEEEIEVIELEDEATEDATSSGSPVEGETSSTSPEKVSPSKGQVAASVSAEMSSNPPPDTITPADQPTTRASSNSSAQKRKRTPKAWEVIVIDDSDDDDEEVDTTPVKRTTRSRRRRRGEELSEGL